MNYKIIQDEKLLREFIDWLPVLKPEEKYYLCLFARNKYCKELTHIKTDKAQLKRFISDKERMFNKIKQLEVEYGAYMQKDKIVPQEALALYITPNPRNMWRASVNTMVKLAQSIRDTNVLMNPHQEALSEIQKAKGTTHYVDFDIDFPSDIGDTGVHIDNIKENIAMFINNEAVTYLRTRGGLHVLINVSKVEGIYKKSFYQNLKKIADVDQTGDQLIPVPGTFQGGFTPYFINL
jgi:hypothetical protein